MKPLASLALVASRLIIGRVHLGALGLAMLLIASPFMYAATTPPHLADYDAELRKSDGRVDTRAMAQRLAELGVTKYYWLVWHAATDWDDLKLFLPQAVKAHIDTWVYLWGQDQDPAAIAKMLDSLGSPDLIRKHGETVGSIWLSRDELPARAWIQRSALSEEVKHRLLNRGKGNQ